MLSKVRFQIVHILTNRLHVSNVSEYIPHNAINTFFKVLKEDLFNNQVLLQPLIISSILVILLCDSGVFL